MKDNRISAGIFGAVVALSLLSVEAASAAETSDSTRKYIHRLGLDLRGAYIAPTRRVVEDNYIGSPARDAAAAMNLKYSFSFSDATRQGRLYPGAYQGIGIGAETFFDNSRTGVPFNAYLFQGAPIFRLAPGLTFDYEWNFGASFGWHRYNSHDNPLNLIVGSPVNAYINLGFMLNYRIAPNWSVAGGLDLTHYSNGNTSWPNPGVNTIGGRVGVTYTFDAGERVRTLADHSEVEPFKPHLSYDLVLYGAVRKKMMMIEGYPEVLRGHFGIAGFNFAPMYNFNRFLRAGVSLDVQYDESSDLKDRWVDGSIGENVRFYRPPFFDQVSWGLSARGELVMPIFTINAGMGYNLIGNSDSKNFYQVLALKIHVVKSFYVHIGYQLNSFKNPNNLMIGLGYRFHDKR